MKVSINAIREFNQRYHAAAEPAPEGVDKLVEIIGAQLGAVEEVIDWGKRFDNVFVVKVVSVADHPNADKLHVCKVDDGGVATGVERDQDGLVQVVCGALNVRAGMLAVWLPPGATVPESVDKEPFVLEARPLRGVVSNGMLASLRELGLGDDHSGIAEVDEAVTPGTPFAKAYDLAGDAVLDIENKMFTHRPDCFGMMGVAREIAGIQGQKFTSPDWYRADATVPQPQGELLPLTVKNELPDQARRFTAIAIRNVTVKQSPLWLKIALAKVGIRPINNIVDITNYYMILTGQPLHAYDYDKVRAGHDAAEIVVRNPHEGETITLLNGKTITPRPGAIMIANADGLIGIGGVMGSADTEVGESTTSIILESASFDLYNIRRTSMAHGLFTDAVTRFSKGQSPLQCLAVLAKAIDDIANLAGGEVAGPVIDGNHLPAEVMRRGSLHAPVAVSAPFINARLGSDLTAGQMTALLQNVEFSVSLDGDELTVAAPFWRTDIEIPEDVVEEIGRLHGYDKLPLNLPRRDIKPAARDAQFDFKDTLRITLARAGANELQTYTFVHGDLLVKAGQDVAQAFTIRNALSPGLQYYRLSLTPSLLEKVHPNIKQGFREFALFEIGKVHHKHLRDDSGLPKELERTALVIAADAKTQQQSYQGAPYYQAKQYLIYALQQLGLEQAASFVPLAPDDADVATSYYQPGRSATIKIGETIIGRIGEYKPSVARAFKLPPFCAGFELGLESLLQHARSGSRYAPLSLFPASEQDITLRVPAELPFAQLQTVLVQSVASEPALTARVTPLDIYQAADDPGHKQITYRLQLQRNDRTLTTNEVNQLLQNAAQAAAGIGAERI